jgi:hypothetical protein
VLWNCYRGRGVFRLRLGARSRAPLPGSQTEVYEALDEERLALSYFALSVVWRAALCDWICRGEKYERLCLGRYEEGMRKYLNGDTGIPTQLGVMVVLSSLNQPWLAMCFPINYREDSYHCYRFHIPGITFVVTVGGRDAQGAADRISILERPYPLLIGDIGDRKVQDEMMLVSGYVPPRGYKAPLVEGTEKG